MVLDGWVGRSGLTAYHSLREVGSLHITRSAHLIASHLISEQSIPPYY
jgi:hypothetical protein